MRCSMDNFAGIDLYSTNNVTAIVDTCIRKVFKKKLKIKFKNCSAVSEVLQSTAFHLIQSSHFFEINFDIVLH